MSYPIIDVRNQAYWNFLYDESKEAREIKPGGAYYPIPAFEIPFLISSQVLIVKPFSKKAKSTWRFAGYFSQRFQVGTGGAASSLPTVESQRISLRLNRSRLVIFHNHQSSYELVFEPFYWMKDIRLTIWEYTGPVQNLSDSLEEIRSKVDDIATYGS